MKKTRCMKIESFQFDTVEELFDILKKYTKEGSNTKRIEIVWNEVTIESHCR